MNMLLRLTLLAGLLTVALAAATKSAALATCFGLDVRALPSKLEELQVAVRYGEQLEAKRLVTLQRTAAREATAMEAATGRLSLREAADRFRDLDGDLPALTRRMFRMQCPGQSEEERYCRQVIATTSYKLTGRAEADTVIAGMQAELAVVLRATPVARKAAPSSKDVGAFR
jgi:hypothetical protein